jgi:hypothetical protein
MVSSRWRRAADRLCNFLTKNEDALQRYAFSLVAARIRECIDATRPESVPRMVGGGRGRPSTLSRSTNSANVVDTFVSYTSSPKSVFMSSRGDPWGTEEVDRATERQFSALTLEGVTQRPTFEGLAPPPRIA